MSRHFTPLTPEATGVPAILIDAARCWREARDRGRSVQPCLFQTLDQYDCTMLAPVLDSLCLIYEAALERPMMVGDAFTLSDDEHLLLGLVDGSEPRQCLTCAHDVRNTLASAVCSTRVMLALTLGKPIARTPQ
jgi:hypothetical protein